LPPAIFLRFLAILLLVVFFSGCSQSSNSSVQNGVAPLASASPRSTSPRTDSLVGKVIRVIDGDTIDVLDTSMNVLRVRLKGIDAPERGQAFYQVSKENLEETAINREVTITWNKSDRWNRLIGKVSLDGKDVCLEQIRVGLAWHFKKYQNEQSEEDRQFYDSAEREARLSRRGLWHDDSPTAPWMKRDRQRTTSLREFSSRK
jgi:endonuclease YncB( thermonuclease family)